MFILSSLVGSVGNLDMGSRFGGIWKVICVSRKAWGGHECHLWLAFRLQAIQNKKKKKKLKESCKLLFGVLKTCSNTHACTYTLTHTHIGIHSILTCTHIYTLTDTSILMNIHVHTYTQTCTASAKSGCWVETFQEMAVLQDRCTVA